MKQKKKVSTVGRGRKGHPVTGKPAARIPRTPRRGTRGADLYLHHSTPELPEEFARSGLPVPTGSAGPVDLEADAGGRRADGRSAEAFAEQTGSLLPGDMVKLAFLAKGRGLGRQPARSRRMAAAKCAEVMFVEVTTVEGKGAGRAFRGEVRNVPISIDDREIAVGSPVTFRAEHIHSVCE